eukprot:11186659-Lingulodinium_polyedra.AAC.1
MVHDVFHREWNDTKGALTRADLWWVVLLTTCTFNLCFGPWEGAGWFEKMRGASKELLRKQKATGPLWGRFYSAVCRDKGEVAVGSSDHMQQVLDAVATDEAFSLKGPKATLKRWYQWMGAAAFHDRAWNSRLLVLVAMCMEMGLAKTLSSMRILDGPALGQVPCPSCPEDVDSAVMAKAARG